MTVKQMIENFDGINNKGTRSENMHVVSMLS